MRFVYLLEDDPKFLLEMTEALLAIDPKLQIRHFRTLQRFVDWVKLVMTDGAVAIARGGTAPEGAEVVPIDPKEVCTLQLVVSKVEFLGVRQLGLMKKTRDLFVKAKICTKEDPTAFVLTAFEDPNFHIHEMKDRILSNIIMKPFDRLILQQHLNFALDGRHPPSKQAIAPYKAKAVIEVLKNVEMEFLSVVGFRTSSDRELPPGGISKYYGSLFASVRHRSVMARTVSCLPNPDRPGHFLAEFSFFGLDATQISNLRRKVIKNKARDSVVLSKDRSEEMISLVRFVFLEDRDDTYQIIEATLKRKVKNAVFYRYKNLSDFLLEWDPSLDNQKRTIKFLSPDAVEIELSEIGQIKSVGIKASFDEKPFVVGQSILSFFESQDHDRFREWLKVSRGDWFSFWPTKSGTCLMHLCWDGERKFRIIEASFENIVAYTKAHSRLAKAWDFMFVGNRFIRPSELKIWNDVFAGAQSRAPENVPRNMVLSMTEYSDQDERQLADVFDDIFYAPFERVYILQKLLGWKSDIEILEDPVEVSGIQYQETIKAARPVQIEELSEAGLIVDYDREMSPGSFREFVLWQAYEVDAPELIATCNYSEPSTTPGHFKLHFVFFAMKDTLLKGIRSWILSHFARSKSEK